MRGYLKHTSTRLVWANGEFVEVNAIGTGTPS
jgi:hypothetical protein